MYILPNSIQVYRHTYTLIRIVLKRKVIEFVQALLVGVHYEGSIHVYACCDIIYMHGLHICILTCLFNTVGLIIKFLK